LLIRSCAVLWNRALDHDVAVCMEFVTPVVRFLLWEASRYKYIGYSGELSQQLQTFPTMPTERVG
jgi:hypothetical protein